MRREDERSTCDRRDRSCLESECTACLCNLRDDDRTARTLACPPYRRVASSDEARRAPLLHSITEGITQHHNVSKKRVVRSSAPFFPCDSPVIPVGKKSTGGGVEAEAEAAEERASRDCASEVAGEVCSSTAVSMSADMMSCVQRKSERRERRESEI